MQNNHKIVVALMLYGLCAGDYMHAASASSSSSSTPSAPSADRSSLNQKLARAGLHHLQMSHAGTIIDYGKSPEIIKIPDYNSDNRETGPLQAHRSGESFSWELGSDFYSLKYVVWRIGQEKPEECRGPQNSKGLLTLAAVTPDEDIDISSDGHKKTSALISRYNQKVMQDNIPLVFNGTRPLVLPSGDIVGYNVPHAFVLRFPKLTEKPVTHDEAGILAFAAKLSQKKS